MILTLTPNPAIDLTYHIESFVPGSTHRMPTPLARAGGKGINVARVLAGQGFPVEAVATAGGQTGLELESGLKEIRHRLVPVAAATRRTIAFFDEKSGQTSIFNEFGAPLSATEWQALAVTVTEELQGASILLASGSLPTGAPADFYPGLIALAKHLNVPSIIDVSGAWLLSAASAGADLLKPNRAELAEATGEKELLAGARVLMRLGARRILVSDGENGMLAFENGRAGYLSARLAEPLAGNPTGAGDAAVAGAATVLASAVAVQPGDAQPAGGQPADGELKNLLRRAAAWGSAAVLMPGAGEISARWKEFESEMIVEEPFLMALTPTRELMDAAVAGGFGQGAFNVLHLETIEGLIAGAELAQAPLILQISENCIAFHGGLLPIAKATLAAAEAASVPIAVHLDHAEDENLALRAVDLGFGSIMFDGAKLPYELNVAATRRVADYAHAHGVYVEAELGEVGGKDGAHAPGVLTDPVEAAEIRRRHRRRCLGRSRWFLGCYDRTERCAEFGKNCCAKRKFVSSLGAARLLRRAGGGSFARNPSWNA
ncbi:fructose/tagatose bisphosphate aldolase [Renibacterium salmoninarum ATCC 33209]|uniref:Fructose/tagatose bisphosphate aldolase n=1 Tax=Renibacterium salmoninarum (strain ATCC 33209 / DSM 20767 / JCM 11484 / NBRC 15589 / NCIMB 2235) TaxID=288705 RepID=A9WN70_RENSM|nr:fructose/tagatose bisphosphate aldolase [Renibacterium salmoninarum ATCC 33209]